VVAQSFKQRVLVLLHDHGGDHLLDIAHDVYRHAFAPCGYARHRLQRVSDERVYCIIGAAGRATSCERFQVGVDRCVVFFDFFNCVFGASLEFSQDLLGLVGVQRREDAQFERLDDSRVGLVEDLTHELLRPEKSLSEVGREGSDAEQSEHGSFH
jgi:hypothetical protein